MTMSSAARMLAFDDFAEALAAAFSAYRASATSDFRASLSHLYVESMGVMDTDISEDDLDDMVWDVARLEGLEEALWNDFINSYKAKTRNPSLPITTDELKICLPAANIAYRLDLSSPEDAAFIVVVSLEQCIYVIVPPPPSISVALLGIFAKAIAGHYTQTTKFHGINPRGKAQEVRAKILAHYFTSVDTIGRVFADVDEKILPSAMEWIGRDRLGFSAMYNLLRSNPLYITPLHNVGSYVASGGVCSGTKDVCPKRLNRQCQWLRRIRKCLSVFVCSPFRAVGQHTS